MKQANESSHMQDIYLSMFFAEHYNLENVFGEKAILLATVRFKRD